MPSSICNTRSTCRRRSAHRPRHPRWSDDCGWLTVSEYIETNVLIIGSGIAGTTATLELADRGMQVTVVTRATEPEESNTLWAPGGIIYHGEHNSPGALTQDILRAGALASATAGRPNSGRGGAAGLAAHPVAGTTVDFDRTDDGELSLALEGGHSMPRRPPRG